MGAMKLEGEQVLLRVYLRNTDSYGMWRVAADSLVERAQQAGLAGATLLRGISGIDAAGNVLETGVWSLVEHVPVIVEFVDGAQNIGRFLTAVAEILPEGLITLERAHVMLYRRSERSADRARLRLDVPAAIIPLSTLPHAEEFPMMALSESGQLLRIFIGESDEWQGEPLARAIVLKAHELGLAGATVLHGAMGFGASSRVHTARLLELSTDLPVVIEIVESPEKIQQLLPFLDEVVQEGLITLEDVSIVKYRANPGKRRP
jgi:uncharacterized protein